MNHKDMCPATATSICALEPVTPFVNLLSWRLWRLPKTGRNRDAGLPRSSCERLKRYRLEEALGYLLPLRLRRGDS